MIKALKIVATALLQSRLNGKLSKPEHVMAIMQAHQPVGGFSNQEWLDVCAFVVTLEKANIISVAKEVAIRHNLDIRY